VSGSEAPTHQVQGDTPVENILAMFNAARNYRWTDSPKPSLNIEFKERHS
jgi:hypothetical protein